MSNGIFRSSFRALFSTFFGVVGIFLGIFFILVIIGAIASGGKRELDVHGRYKMLADANWKKKPLKHNTPLILAIEIRGIIGTEGLNTESVRQQLVRSQQGALKDGRIKGILLLMNTPGGTVFDGDGIYRILREYKQRFGVPVYAYCEGLCASGGMYVAAAADRIYASPVSLIGSVGVIGTFLNFSETLEKIGVKTKTVTRGKDKDAMNPLRPWKEGEDEEMQKIITSYYDDFVDVVTSNRPRLNRDKLINDYGARVFPANVAQEYGFIDEVVDNRSAALEALTKEVGIASDYQVILFEEKNWLECFLKGKSFFPLKEKMLPEGFLYLTQFASSNG